MILYTIKFTATRRSPHLFRCNFLQKYRKTPKCVKLVRIEHFVPLATVFLFYTLQFNKLILACKLSRYKKNLHKLRCLQVNQSN